MLFVEVIEANRPDKFAFAIDNEFEFCVGLAHERLNGLGGRGAINGLGDMFLEIC